MFQLRTFYAVFWKHYSYEIQCYPYDLYLSQLSRITDSHFNTLISISRISLLTHSVCFIVRSILYVLVTMSLNLLFFGIHAYYIFSSQIMSIIFLWWLAFSHILIFSYGLCFIFSVSYTFYHWLFLKHTYCFYIDSSYHYGLDFIFLFYFLMDYFLNHEHYIP